MDATDRFAALVRADPDTLASHLDEAALLIAAHARDADDPLDVDAYVTRIDDLARACQEPGADDVLDVLFNIEGFGGNTESYYDPRNSCLDQVLERRVGIPITLSVLVIEVGRRVGVTFVPIGMPGHFLVRHGDTLYDPFEGGRPVTMRECAERFHAIHGHATPFDERHLQPASAHEVIARMLANLRQVYLSRRDSVALEWVLRLRSLLPSATVEERAERAGVLAALGRFDKAADVLAEIAPAAGEERGRTLRSKAKQLRARLN